MRIYLIRYMTGEGDSDLEENIMKILLAAVNAKYIHSNLAVYSLKAYAKDPADKHIFIQVRRHKEN